MKHLLRKLHIGGGGGAAAASSSLSHPHDRLGDPHSNPPTTASSDSSASTISPISSGGRDAADPSSEASGQGSRCDSVDFNYLEEEYQVNLALAMSVSDPHGKQDPDLAQMDAAKRISLGCASVAHAGGRGEDALANFLSLQYWNYNVLNYNEKVLDGFYDVYGIVSTPALEGMIPSLVDLQATSISDSIDYEAVLVNRTTDSTLQQLEKRAVAISLECRPEDPITSGLVQKIADLVVNSMGGPVGDPVIISERWRLWNQELKASLNTVVLPIGCLEVGLSRHRALLFKVLADRIDLPCRLVKGSYYTGTDEGAVNLIRVKSDSEYIIDLMGAPGTLIPSELPLPSSQFQNTGLDLVNSNTIAQTVKDLCLALDKRVTIQLENKDDKSEVNSCDPFVPKTIALQLEEKLRPERLLEGSDVSTSEKNNTERFEHEFGKLFPSLSGPPIDTCGTKESFSTARQMKVNDVSKYVLSAAKDPEFAQKLYAVLSESGTSTSPDLLSDINSSQRKRDHEIHGKSDRSIKEHSAKEWMQNQLGDADINRIHSSFTKTKEGLKFLDTDIYKRVHVDELTGGGAQCSLANVRRIAKDVEVKGKVSLGEHQESERMENSGTYIVTGANNDKINTVMDDVAECEIPWEDLQIGDRIGHGSCGEVLHADWNGTEVAVKKFLDQDLSGDALEQFRCEVKIMLRLRHPNVVLFMGAVTRPPNLSILTEFLPRGSLYRILHRPNVQLDEKRRLRMAMDVAKGMNYLHTSHPTIVHRDLKSPNLLVDKNWVVKVCDFGLSRLKHHTFLSSKSSAGTPEWMAPEVLRNEPSNEKSDVYSFGVILWELATLHMPWSGMNPMQVVGAVGFQNRRLDIPKEVDANIAQIICDCWQSDPNQRPSFAQLIDSFRHLQRLVVGTGRSLK